MSPVHATPTFIMLIKNELLQLTLGLQSQFAVVIEGDETVSTIDPRQHAD